MILNKIALALSILKELLKNKRVINILSNLWAYFNNRRYFPILMLKFVHDYGGSSQIGTILIFWCVFYIMERTSPSTLLQIKPKMHEREKMNICMKKLSYFETNISALFLWVASSLFHNTMGPPLPDHIFFPKSFKNNLIF